MGGLQDKSQDAVMEVQRWARERRWWAWVVEGKQVGTVEDIASGRDHSVYNGDAN